MKDAEDDERVLFRGNTVNDDIRQARHDEFARSLFASRTSKTGDVLQASDTLENTPAHKPGGDRAMRGDVRADVN